MQSDEAFDGQCAAEGFDDDDLACGGKIGQSGRQPRPSPLVAQAAEGLPGRPV